MENVTIQEQIKNSEAFGGMETTKAIPGKFNNDEITKFVASLPISACVVENGEIKSDFDSAKDARMYARSKNLLFASVEDGYYLQIRQF